MNILLTNDDGIHASGLEDLWQALKGKGSLFTVAPSEQQSAQSLSITTTKPLYVKENVWGATIPNVWSVSGTPSDCVKVALSLLNLPIDLVVAGINHGANTGRNVLYSGTIAGAIEAVLHGLPAVAFSYCADAIEDQALVSKYIKQVLQFVIKNPMPPETLLNVNFPDPSKGSIKGLRLATQGKGYISEDFSESLDDRGEPCFMLGSRLIHKVEAPDSDVALVAQGYVALSPLHVGELTDYNYLNANKSSFVKEFCKSM